jgi:hypothetical protein
MRGAEHDVVEALAGMRMKEAFHLNLAIKGRLMLPPGTKLNVISVF